MSAQEYIRPHSKLENQTHLSKKKKITKNGVAFHPSFGSIPSAELQTAVAAQRGAIGGGGSGRDH